MGRRGKGRGEEWEVDSFGPRSSPLLFCGSTPMQRKQRRTSTSSSTEGSSEPNLLLRERAVPAGTHAPISVSKIVATRLIVEPCPLAKLNDGLSRLHSADEDTVSYGYWSSMVHDTHIRAPVTGLFATLPVRHLDVSHPGA